MFLQAGRYDQPVFFDCHPLIPVFGRFAQMRKSDIRKRSRLTKECPVLNNCNGIQDCTHERTGFMRMWLARSMSKSLSRPFPSGLSAGCDIASVAFCRLLVTRALTPCIQYVNRYEKSFSVFRNRNCGNVPGGNRVILPDPAVEGGVSS